MFTLNQTERKELDTIKSRIRELKEWDKIKKSLQARGYKNLDTYDYREILASKRFVIKEKASLNCYSPKTYVRKSERKYLIPTFYVGPCIVQPRAKTNTKSVDKAMDFFNEKIESDIDLHDENVGVYKSKPVIFDW